MALTLLLPAASWAQGKAAGSAASSKEKLEAKALYDQGNVHFNLDEWPQAIEQFKAAYRLYPDAIFLYNIAQCYRKIGNVPDALGFYKKYLREKPDARNRSEVEKRIEELEAAQQAAQARSREAPRPTIVPPALPAVGAAAAQPAAPVPPEIRPSPAAPEATTPAPAPPLPSPIGAAAPAPEAATTPAGVDVSAKAEASRPPPGLTRQWWFWTGIGAAVAGSVVLAVILSSSSSTAAPFHGDLDPPILTVPK